MKRDAIIDLSQRMIPGKEQFKLERHTYDVTEILPEVKHRPEIWYILSEVLMSSHEGTHIEVPYHHLKDGVDVADFPLENLVGDAVVLDFSDKKHGEAITLDELKAHEERLMGVDIVLIRTDMDKLFRDPVRWVEQPYLTAEAMDWLIDAVKPTVVGTDATGFEVPGTDYQPNHMKLFQHGIPMLESLTNLSEIADERVTLFILPLPIERLDASPVRVAAIRKGVL